jgi:transcriptional regulator with XRE-family HTH domain
MGVIDRLMVESRRRGLPSQRKVEAALGLPQGRISKWLNGTGEVPWDDIVRWADHLGLSLDVLAGRDPSRGLTIAEQAVLEIARDLGLDEARARLLLKELPGRTPRVIPTEGELTSPGGGAAPPKRPGRTARRRSG